MGKKKYTLYTCPSQINEHHTCKFDVLEKLIYAQLTEPGHSVLCRQVPSESPQADTHESSYSVTPLFISVYFT
jgi:hypothetical protein